ncbi:MAG: cytochrome b/b6 domain-containing protein [Kaistella sp.]|nr:cytochrome b/b6 domain-containing protein [Kaistella sp.]
MRKFTQLHRILHWIIAAAMFVLFMTGFLRMFWMSKKTISTAVNSELNAQQLQLPQESVLMIAKNIINPMFEWHINFAYVLVGAYVLRLLYMFWKGIRFPNPFSPNTDFKDKLQGMIYLLFYIFLAIQVLTGMSLQYELANEETLETAEKIHKFAVYWLPVFVMLHFSGIVYGELSNKKGIVSGMIGGDQKNARS